MQVAAMQAGAGKRRSQNPAAVVPESGNGGLLSGLTPGVQTERV